MSIACEIGGIYARGKHFLSIYIIRVNKLIFYRDGSNNRMGGILMWTREEIKGEAKEFLQNFYWRAFVVCLIVILVAGAKYARGNNYGKVSGLKTWIIFNNEDYEYQRWREVDSGRLTFCVGDIRFSSMGVGLVILSLITGLVLEVGRSVFFLNGFKRDVSIKNLFSNFRYDEIFTIIGTQMLRFLCNAFWYCIFFIPGIVKYYEYKFVPYILAEESYLGPKEIFKKSRDITDGHKLDMFILDLSFLGWYILGGLLFGLGLAFVAPYKEATNAKLYNKLMGHER